MARASGSFGVLLGVILAGCGAASPTGSSTVVDDPLPSAENQQGHAEETPTPGLPVTGTPIPNTYVWCQDAAGDGCLRVTAALGAITIKDPANAPTELTLLEDLADDCTAVGIPEIRTRIDAALPAGSAGWHDHMGPQLDPVSFPQTYVASGCIGDYRMPTVKIAASSTSSPRMYLVRVWDGPSY